MWPLWGPQGYILFSPRALAPPLEPLGGCRGASSHPKWRGRGRGHTLALVPTMVNTCPGRMGGDRTCWAGLGGNIPLRWAGCWGEAPGFGGRGGLAELEE